MSRLVIHSADNLRLVRCDGPDTFAVEFEHDDAPDPYRALLGLLCDEDDGPITVRFSPIMHTVDLDLAALRHLLDRAEADLLQRRAEWRDPEDAP